MTQRASPQTAQTQPTLFFEQPVNTTEQRVLVAAIKPNPNMDPRDVLKSVKYVGVLQALLLKPSQDPVYSFDIIAGGRRHNSALHYNLLDVPAIITTGTETEAQLAMLRALENTARSANPVAEGRSFRQVLDSGMYASEKDMAVEMGLDVKLVQKRLKLVDRLPEDILVAVENGSLAESIAERIVNLDHTYQGAAITATRETLAEGSRFTQKDLKAVRTRQKDDMSACLSTLQLTLPAAAMQPILQLSPAQLLAEEFRAIAQEREVELEDVMRELGYVQKDSEPGQATLTSATLTPSAPLQEPAAVLTQTPTPVTAAVPPFPSETPLPFPVTEPQPQLTAVQTPEPVIPPFPFDLPKDPAPTPSRSSPLPLEVATPTLESDPITEIPALLAIESQAAGETMLLGKMGLDSGTPEALGSIPWPDDTDLKMGQPEVTLSMDELMAQEAQTDTQIEQPDPAPATHETEVKEAQSAAPDLTLTTDLLRLPIQAASMEDTQEQPIPWPDLSPALSNGVDDIETKILTAQIPEEQYVALPLTPPTTPADRVNLNLQAANPAPRASLNVPTPNASPRLNINTRR